MGAGIDSGCRRLDGPLLSKVAIMPYNTSQKRKDCLKRFYDKRRQNGQCTRCGDAATPGRTHCAPCSQYLSEANSARLRAIREKVIEGYGGCCACCGQTGYEFLSIDHCEYRACEERKKFGRLLTTTQLCLKIIRENFPKTFQILCHNCNMALGIYGFCPHHPEVRRSTGHLKIA
jgi:hypothetical protein